MQDSRLRDDGADADEGQVSGGVDCGGRNQQEDAGDGFGRAREVTEPLSEPDLIEFVDHLLHAGELSAGGCDEQGGKDDFERPKSDGLARVRRPKPSTWKHS